MNALDPESFALMQEAVATVPKGYKGLMIGGDGANFSAGANLGFFLFVANVAAWDQLESVLRLGQQTYMALKYAPFPVVTAQAGLALGGGCELNLHADAVQAHIESYMGLVEVGVGVIPGRGGCKEMLLRQNRMLPAKGPMPAVSRAFETIMLAKTSASAEEAKEMGLLNEKSRISMSRQRLLADAKALVLELADGYQPPQPESIILPGPTGKAALLRAVDQFRAQGKTTPHDEVVAEALASVLSGDEADMTAPVSEQQLLELECKHFLRLTQSEATIARIEHMLKNGKPLRN